jgi:hypothetical protein
MRQLLVAGLIGALIRALRHTIFRGGKLFRLAPGALWGLVQVVVGVGAVVVVHSNATMTDRPATLKVLISGYNIAYHSNVLTRSGLVQQVATHQPP